MKKKNNEKLTKSKFIIKEAIKYLKNFFIYKNSKNSLSWKKALK